MGPPELEELEELLLDEELELELLELLPPPMIWIFGCGGKLMPSPR